MALCSGITTVQQRNKAKLLIAQYFDSVASCLLVDFPDSKMVHKRFDHDCNCHWLQRRQFQAVDKNYEICGIVDTMNRIRTDI